MPTGTSETTSSLHGEQRGIVILRQVFDPESGAVAILDLDSVTVKDLVDGVYLLRGLTGEVNPSETDRPFLELINLRLGELTEELGEQSGNGSGKWQW